MNIHEYQGKELFRKYSINVPEGRPAFSVEEAVKGAKELGGPIWVVKAQIHAGGRGKGGGVKIAKSIEEVKSLSEEILGMQLITKQTGPAGQLVRRLYIEDGADIARELYLGMIVDRESGGIVVMASTEGGMEIETVAHETPEKIHYVKVNPLLGLADYQCRDLAFKLDITGKAVFKAVKFMKQLYKLFTEKDCSIVEINPLVITGDNDVIALDAKVNFDDNALFRHKDIMEYRDTAEEDPSELEAKKFDLSYVNLDGNIGCMVNGAGLAMSTMDIIKHYGGEPANFLDVGGGATKENVTAAFKIITSDERVKGIFINIFGGIMKCDVLAAGVVAAVEEIGLTVPLVVRLEGTNVEEGRRILDESGMKITTVSSMGEGAKTIIEQVSL